MADVIKAGIKHVEGIIRVCTEGYWATYSDLYSDDYIERVVADFYNIERVTKEVTVTSLSWGGYFVAVEDEKVIGAGGGGMISSQSGEVFVLYMDPNRRNEGVGTRILEQITKQQMEQGATEQWVSVQEGNEKGLPFYKAKGFSIVERRPSYGNREEDAYMALRLVRSL